MTEEIIRITDPDTDRYHTFGYISWWQQETVRNATVMVVGAGALGNEVLKNLALMGIGNILICDFDTIEDSNLSRSVLFRTTDRGRRKVDAAAERVKELNADVNVKTWHGDINNEMGMGVFRHVDAMGREEAGFPRLVEKIIVEAEHNVGFRGAALKPDTVQQCHAIGDRNEFHVATAFRLKRLFHLWAWAPVRREALIGVDGELILGDCLPGKGQCAEHQGGKQGGGAHLRLLFSGLGMRR